MVFRCGQVQYSPSSPFCPPAPSFPTCPGNPGIPSRPLLPGGPAGPSSPGSPPFPGIPGSPGGPEQNFFVKFTLKVQYLWGHFFPRSRVLLSRCSHVSRAFLACRLGHSFRLLPALLAVQLLPGCHPVPGLPVYREGRQLQAFLKNSNFILLLLALLRH